MNEFLSILAAAAFLFGPLASMCAIAGVLDYRSSHRNRYAIRRAKVRAIRAAWNG